MVSTYSGQLRGQQGFLVHGEDAWSLDSPQVKCILDEVTENTEIRGVDMNLEGKHELNKQQQID